MISACEGFWLPASLRSSLVTSATEWEQLAYLQGRPVQAGEAQAATARWPRLSTAQWRDLLAGLQANRRQSPRGREYWERLQAALAVAGKRLADPGGPLHQQALEALPTYTGYAPQMIQLTLGALGMMSLAQFPAAYRAAQGLDRRVAQAWQEFPGLPGWVRFFPGRGGRPQARRPQGAPLQELGGRLAGLPFRFKARRALFDPPMPPDLVLGYGAGNVPGTALLIAFLAQAATLAGSLPPPAVLVRNSRQEPIFAPLVLQALEAADPELVAALAVLVWDYEDADLQGQLLAQADLAIAAASDETIDRLSRQAQEIARPGKASLRLHAHGHKVSFAVISRDVLLEQAVEPVSSLPFPEVAALLAGLDSVFWDQNGCLSARWHFVETGARPELAADYARTLEAQLRRLAAFLPRGAWPRRPLLERFDRYKQLEATGQVQVFSQYGDDYLVVLDRRPLQPQALFGAVNDCQGRTVIVRPVTDLMEIPHQYLRGLPPGNLQTLSVALRPGQPASDERFLRFAAACGERGVTALRSAGRGAFPQLAYSWDGLLPLDVAANRPPGHFTTIEFEDAGAEMLETFRRMAYFFK